MSETLQPTYSQDTYQGLDYHTRHYWQQVENFADELAGSIQVSHIVGSSDDRENLEKTLFDAYEKVSRTLSIPIDEIKPALHHVEKCVGDRVAEVLNQEFEAGNVNESLLSAIENLPLSFNAVREGHDTLFNKAVTTQKKSLLASNAVEAEKLKEQAKDLTALSAHFGLKLVIKNDNPEEQDHPAEVYKLKQVLSQVQQVNREKDKTKRQQSRQALSAYVEAGFGMDIKSFDSATAKMLDKANKVLNSNRVRGYVAAAAVLGVAGPLASANGAHAAVVEVHTNRQNVGAAEDARQIDMNKVTIVTPVEVKESVDQVVEPIAQPVKGESKLIVPQEPKVAPAVQANSKNEAVEQRLQPAASNVQTMEEMVEEVIIATPKPNLTSTEKTDTLPEKTTTIQSEEKSGDSANRANENTPIVEEVNDLVSNEAQSVAEPSSELAAEQSEDAPLSNVDNKQSSATEEASAADQNLQTEEADTLTVDINPVNEEQSVEEVIIAAPSEREVQQIPTLPEENADEETLVVDNNTDEMLIVATPSERKVEDVVEHTPAEITEDIIVTDDETGETLIIAAPSERSVEAIVEVVPEDSADIEEAGDGLIIASPSTTVVTEKGKSKQAIVELPKPNIIAAPAPAPKPAPVQEAPVISESLEIVAAKALADIDTNALPENIKANIRPNTNWKNVSLVMEYLMKNSDLNESQAIGVIANMMLESDGVNFDINQRGGPAYGAVQWEGPRRTELEAYAAAQNKPASDPIVQLDFLMLELERDAWNGYAELKKAKGSVDAAIIFEEKFERAGAPAIELRKAYAIGLTDAYNLKWHAAEKAAKPDAQTIANIEKKAEITWVAPVEGAEINSHYGDRGGVHHDGIDYPADIGTPLRAMGDGEVIATLTSSDVRLEAWCVNALAGIGHTVASVSDAFQKTVIIQHANGYQTRYDHVSEFAVNVGDKVKAGDTIAKVGSSGCSTGLHVHVGANLNGVSIDPATLLK